MESKQLIFFISDRTGVTIENLGRSLLHQFESVQCEYFTFPFIDSIQKAQELLIEIKTLSSSYKEKQQAIVFSSLVKPELRSIFDHKDFIFHIDFFNTFIPPLEQILRKKPRIIEGLTHGIADEARYDERMEAVNFALNNDDGISDKNYQNADVILVGVSRSGKTPTCLYLALQYGILAANYPLTEDDLEANGLPKMIAPYRNKLVGLTIDYKRLNRIREVRKPNSKYANVLNCDFEVRTAEALFKRFDIPYLSTTHLSVEELAASIIQIKSLTRRN